MTNNPSGPPLVLFLDFLNHNIYLISMEIYGENFEEYK